MRSRPRDEVGATSVIVAALLASGLLFGLAALVVDLGLARDTRQAAQVASDASALAAGNILYPESGTCSSGAASPCLGDAVTEAVAYAIKNYTPPAADASKRLASADFATCSVPTGFTAADARTCIAFDSLTLPTQVSVVMPTRDVATPLASGNVSSVSSVAVSGAAVAAVKPSTRVTCGLCVLGGVSTNNSDFTVTAGSIAVNGSITKNSQSIWRAVDGKIQVAGTINGADPATVTDSSFQPSPVKTTTFVDPWASMAMPTVGSLPNRSSTTTCNGTIAPGVYGDLSLGNRDVCTLDPGLYIITGLWQEGNQSVIQGSGVTLYFTCGTPSEVRPCTSGDPAGTGGRLDAKNGTIPISSGASGYAAMALMYDRLNPNPLELQGNGTTEITGGVYAVNSVMQFNGNSQFGINGGPVIVKDVDGVGNPSGLSVTNSRDATVSTSPGTVGLER